LGLAELMKKGPGHASGPVNGVGAKLAGSKALPR
jgi:hypothetical protein